jgi:asparagine synthase (glutamine-hydrolysing)
MCGIAGILSRNPGLLNKLQAMTDVQAHRGPDGVGHLVIGSSARVSGGVMPEVKAQDFLALGHRRLAILDCSPAGFQPMNSHDGKDWICFNGEIYNYLEIRAELSKSGFSFRTGTDTEVILAAYRAWGVDCFKRFNGMWGIALWDGSRKCLVLSRDRFGVKPLFFAVKSEAIVFSSEIKAILRTGVVSPKLNVSVAMDYLKWSLVNHNNETFFSDIMSFPPGHYAIVDERQIVDPIAFWTLKVSPQPELLGISDASNKFINLFEDAVSLRMRSDVPVGSCLSGGLDSSAIVCAANELQSHANRIHTFNAASEDPRFDERYWCEIVNKKIDANFHHIFPGPEGFIDDLDNLIWHQEEPFTSTSIYAQWAIMRAARESNIPVLLDGQGADEALCGYRKYYFFYMKDLFKKYNFYTLFKEVFGLAANGDRGLLRWQEGVRYLPSILKARVNDISTVLTPQGLEAWSESFIDLGNSLTIANRQALDLTSFSVPSLLRYEDRNSMAWSIETRVPFLDYRLVEWLVNLAPSLKMHGGQTKALMRKALFGKVPDQILNRRDKMGFVTAQEVWMREHLSPLIKKSILSQNFPLSSLIDSNLLYLAYERWRSGAVGLGQSDVFRIFILAKWAEKFNVKLD